MSTGGRSTSGGGAAYTAALCDLLLGLLVWTSTTKFGGDMDHRCSPKVAKNENCSLTLLFTAYLEFEVRLKTK